MAPLTTSGGILDLDISSLELDNRSTRLLKRNVIPSSPTEMLQTLTARDLAHTKQPDHGGAVDPNDVNMKGIQALFAIIGASFVLGIIWFFFWAKNGGFQWRKGDWEDYKSTVLRRKGPNGTTLSNATKSTVLGGGSVVGEGYSDESGSTIHGTNSDSMTEVTSDVPVLDEMKPWKKETAKERKIREAKEATWEGGNDNDVRAYMREKPARVGGINKDSEAFHYGTDYTDTEGSQIHSQRASRTHGPRATSSRQASPEKRQQRRDFSYTNDEAFSTVSSQPDMPQAQYPDIPPPAPPHRPGRYHSPSKQYTQADQHRTPQYPRGTVTDSSYSASVVSEVQNHNTKTYHHPLPSLSGQGQSQSPVRGYRRDRRDSFDD